MGFTNLRDLVGRTDLLVKSPALTGRAALVNVEPFLFRSSMVEAGNVSRPEGGTCQVPTSNLNVKIMHAIQDAIESGSVTDIMFRIRNSDRSVGATAAGLIARLYGRDGMPNRNRIRLRFEGEAGQSFGAWCIAGLELELKGFAQDGVAKGISGGYVVVTLDYTASDYGGEIQSVAGNNIGYGATGGYVFIGGRAGHRLGIRNSGATIVAEAAGKYACEYMTRGRVLILGPVENEVGSGMTGGELYIYDPYNEAPRKLHTRSVAIIDCHYVDYEWIHPLINDYYARTGSRQAEYLLKNWAEVRRSRRLRKIVPLAVARKAEDYVASGTAAG
jgi:glutamate synthase domain-containing protein 3